MRKATVLVSVETLKKAISEGEILAEKLLNQNPHDPKLDQLEEAVARLQGVLNLTPAEMAADGTSSIEDYLDDTKMPEFAQEVKTDVEFISQVRAGTRPERIEGAPGASALPEQAAEKESGAGGGADAWVTDRDSNGQPKAPEQVEVPRYAAKKKKEAEPAAAPAPAATPMAPGATAKTGSPLDFVPTEMILKIVEDLPKQEGFAQNKGMQDALIEMTNILKNRPVAPAKPEEGAATAPAAPVTAAKKEPFGGKQAPPFKKKEEKDSKEAGEQGAPAAAFQKDIPQAQGAEPPKLAAEEGKRHDDVPVAPTPNVMEGSSGEKAQDSKTAEESKTAVAPPGWEGTVKEMKDEPGIDNPWALAWSMKNKGYTPHKGSRILRVFGAQYVMKKFGAGSTKWTNDGKLGDIVEDGGRTPEVAQARGMKDEAPAKLERPAVTDMMKLASAVKDAESLGEKLKALYLDAKPLCQVNNTRGVREFVETIYKAYSLCDDAVKVLNKQEMQEAAEEEAAKVKEKAKKSSLLGLRTAAAA
jgi:hypothetical protein